MRAVAHRERRVRVYDLVYHLVVLACLLLCIPLPSVSAVKRHDFKTCDQSGFCKRRRELADRAAAAGNQWKSPYELQKPLLKKGIFHAVVKNQLFPHINFALEIRFQKDGVARILMDEVNGLRQRYNEAGMWAVQTTPELDPEVDLKVGKTQTVVKYGKGRHEIQIQHQPILLTFYRDGQPHIVLNERGLFDMEHFRVKTVGEPNAEELVVQDAEHPEQENVVIPEEAYPGFLPRNEDGMWEESFGGKTDSKPKGPESLSLDITFPGYEHVYGIPQHASSLSLKNTRGGDNAYTDPYRLYNLDVFEYDTDSEMAIYGAIPLMKAHRAGSTVGVFVVSGSEMWIDITRQSTSKAVTSSFKKATKSAPKTSDAGPTSTTTTTHWTAESGILDIFIFLGPSPTDVIEQFTSLTGRTPLPPLFAAAYHQCRWNYLSTEDVLGVQSKFDEADIPFDVIWLDIEYAEEHKYFIWDRRYFAEPEKMQAELAERGRKLVTIVDPHIKKDQSHYIYSEAQELDILSKMPDGKTEFEGWCWTGSSAWPDWFHPKSWDWWISQFAFDKFKGSTKNLFIWNDMNEPSIFNGPEITMQKDTVHYGAWEHRDVHNIGGMIYQNLTAQGLVQRQDPPMRPFVLTRAFFAGSQKYGAMWTGDNLGTWAHLASTVPMLLTNGIAGMTFAGADVGGFFGNPSAEMLVRWYQVGAFMPFFRAHGHIDTKRREPYLFDQPHQGYIRDAIRMRYTLMPAIYTAFYEAGVAGMPILRPQYIMFPEDQNGFAIDDQFYLGSTGLLVKPIVLEGAESTEVYISDDEPYYHYLTNEIYFGASTGGSKEKISAPLGSTPILLRGGSILPRRDIVRRAAVLSWKDPITLVAAMDLSGTKAAGTLYLDDGESYAYEKGEYILRNFNIEAEGTSKNLRISSRAVQSGQTSTGVDSYDPVGNPWARKISDVTVQRIVINGLPSKPTCIHVIGQELGLGFIWTEGVGATAGRRRSGKLASMLEITDAHVPVTQDWDIVLEFEPTSAGCLTSPIKDDNASIQSPDCPVGQFRCQNKGHIPSCILKSRVNDGVCDPECCDGSDEFDGKVACGNRCAVVGDQYRKKTAEEERKIRVGASLRNDMIKFGVKEKKRLEEDQERLREDIKNLQEKEKSAKAQLAVLEKMEAGEIERKKNSKLYERIVEMQHAIEALREQRQRLQTDVKDLSGILGDLSRDFNPNYQDMAVLGASRAFKDWQKANGLLQEDGSTNAEGEDVEQPPIQPAETTEPFKKPEVISDHDLLTLESEDPMSLIDSLSMGLGGPLMSTPSIFKVEEYLPDAWLAPYNSYKQALLQFLARFGVISLPASPLTDRPELTNARETHAKLIVDVEEAEKKLLDATDALGKDWGRDWEWKKLEGTCVEKNAGEYTYSVCFFGEAAQKSNNNNARTSLGTFKSWSTTALSGTDDYYKKQVYADGQRCWNGPARSAKVDLVCATTNALLSVIEPEKCEYLFTVSTPAVCFLPKTGAKDTGGGGEKDEL